MAHEPAVIYRGFPPRYPPGPGRVTRDGADLNAGPSQALWNHSPDGFMWGYGGSGPAQLALALLLDALGKREALRYYQDFKREVVARWDPLQPWEMTQTAVRSWWVIRKGPDALAADALNRVEASVIVGGLIDAMGEREPPWLEVYEALEKAQLFLDAPEED